MLDSRYDARYDLRTICPLGPLYRRLQLPSTQHDMPQEEAEDQPDATPRSDTFRSNM